MVETKCLELGILSVENSTNGAVVTAMDILPNLKQSTIIGELILDIEHCLAGTGASIDEIEYIYSHEQAIEQCRNYFSGKQQPEFFKLCQHFVSL